MSTVPSTYLYVYMLTLSCSVDLTAPARERADLELLSFAKRGSERMSSLHGYVVEKTGRKRQGLLKLPFALRTNDCKPAVKCK